MLRPLAKLVRDLTPKRRWVQFRLRTLFIFTGVICLFLGTWHVWKSVFRPYVEAEAGAIVMGQPVKVRGRFFRFFGPESSSYSIHTWSVRPTSEYLAKEISNRGDSVERNWLCVYEFECEILPYDSPGEWELGVAPEGCAAVRGDSKFVVR
jgi:hypothetical protein